MSSSTESKVETESQAMSPQELAEARQKTIVSWLFVAAAAGLFIYRRPDLAYTIGVFVLALSVLVFVHEWGHYQFARWAGMKVNRFGIGFPPWIYTRRRNDIDYSIGALPIGGMVDIAGLGSEEEMVAAAKGAELTVHAPRTNVPHGQRRFQDASLIWRFWTLFAGPLMNFVFAMIVFIAVFSMIGVPSGSYTNVVMAVSTGKPADKAGIQQGDVIVGINNVRSTDAEALTKLIKESGGKPITVVLERNSQVLRKSIQPEVVSEGKERKAIIGVVFSQVESYQKVGLLGSIAAGWQATTEISGQILAFLKRAVTFNLSSDDKRGVGGPIKIAEVMGASARQGWEHFLILGAGLSVNLGLLNLLPFPALDGGRILFLGYELLVGKPLDPKKEGLVHMVGMVMLLAFMLFITARDILPFIEKGLQKAF
jgi:regulator of sigma E protease